MKKYILELKKVTWPTSQQASTNFVIVIVGILFLAGFFLIADSLISIVFESLYS